MKTVTAIVVQALLVALALAVTILRCWVRLHIEHRPLTASDYFTWGGWVFTFGWFICSIIALRILINSPPVNEELFVESVAYLKTVFIAVWFFDIGLFLCKISIVTFYWSLIPQVFRGLRTSLYLLTAYLGSAFVAGVLIDSLMTRPISHNWSIEHQMESLWNSYPTFAIQWALNMSTDLSLFCFPFFILKHLNLRRRQKLGLVGVFSLGAVTMMASLARFIAYTITDYTLDDETGNTLCTAEMSTAVIVVSLPGLKNFILRSRTPPGSKDDTTSGLVQSNSNIMVRKPGFKSRFTNKSKHDDEVELVSGRSGPGVVQKLVENTKSNG